MAYFHRARVAITGLGVVAPNGNSVETFWSTMLAGQSGIAPITLFDASKHPCQIAGEVKSFDLSAYIDSTQLKIKRLSRQTQLALAASIMALRDAGIDPVKLAPDDPLLVVLGISSSAIEVITQGYDRLLEVGPGRVPTHTVQACQPQQSASVIAGHLACRTQTQTISSACAAGLDAVAVAAERIRAGSSDVALTGGADAPVNTLTFACLAQAGLIAPSSYSPERASRPFDRGHTVGVISEGAGLMVLENMERARARGAHIYAEITGFGTFMDPDFGRPGCGFETAIRAALANASALPADIDYISAHGPSHVVLDREETEAIKRVFGDRAYRLPMSSIKGVTGNPLAAAGGHQIITTALALYHGMVPPTANCEECDPACDLDYVQGRARRQAIGRALINTHGLGNGNSSIVLEKVDSP
jgi:3-oxoacyl-[acyl-carrier-protein] synthase II